MSELGRCVLAVQNKNMARRGRFGVYSDSRGNVSATTVDVGMDFTHLYILAEAPQNPFYDTAYAYINGASYQLAADNNAKEWATSSYIATILSVSGRKFTFKPNYNKEGEYRYYLYFAW